MNAVASPSNRFRASPQMIASTRLASSLPNGKSWRQLAFPIERNIDIDVLREAWEGIASRHEILRTRVERVEDGEPVQIIDERPRADAVTTVAQAAGVTQDDFERIATSLPLPWDAPVALHLLTGGDAQALVLSGSAVFLDAASVELLGEELRRELAGQSPSGEPLQYADYSAWARKQPRGHAGEVADAVDASSIGLSTGKSGGRHRHAASLDMTGEAFANIVSAANDDLRGWTMAAFCGVLRKLGAGDRFAFTSLDGGRTEEGLAASLGDFTQANLVSVDLSTAGTPGSLQAAIASCARKPVDLAATSVVIEYLEARDAGAIANLRRIPVSGAFLHLTVTASPTSIGLHAQASDGEANMVEGVLAAFVAVLRADRDTAWATLQLAAEHARPLDGDRGEPGEGNLARRFEEVAARFADSVALEAKARKVSFRTLAARSGQCAAVLAGRGVGAGDTVVLVVESLEVFVVATLAISRLGATFAPIDVQDAPARRHRILHGLAPRMVIADAPMPDAPGALVLDEQALDRLGSASEPVPAMALADGGRIAYVLHTSGSTGVPKGVAIGEKALANYLDHASACYAWDETDASLVHTSPAVDLTLTGLWPALLAGKTVHQANSRKAFGEFARWLGDGRRWFCKLTPTHLRALRTEAQTAGAKEPIVRGVWVVGGEQFTVRDLEGFGRMEGARIFNEYGPTEATVGCIVHEWRPGDAGGEFVPIGTPIRNMQAVIADRDGLALPAGLSGELLLAGTSLATGYVNDPELTAERFVAAPDSPGHRAYRSGDIARIRADGALSYVGRRDGQLKLRGYRVEAAEIEAALRSVGGVVDAAVVVTDIGDQRELLIAYCVMAGRASLDPTILRQQLRQELPDPMLPNAYVQVRAIPHTASGKRDLRALLAAHPPKTASDAPYVAPRSLVEETLASVWATVLALPRVGIDDNYFALGGDSLKSLQVTALADHKGIRFTLDQLHRHPTIRALAASIEDGGSEVQVHFTKPFELIDEEDRSKVGDDIEDAYPLNLLQEGMIYHREFAPKSAVYHAICSYRISAPFDLELMREAVEAVVQRHPLLRTSFDLTRFSRPMQLVHARYPSPLGYMDVSGMTPQQQQVQVDVWMENEKKTGFELDEFPLIRYMLHKLGDDSFQFSYSFHHEIVDGWSDALMATQIVSRYMARINGQPYEVPKPTSTFRDAIHLEQQALANEATREFWHRHMEDVEVMRLPNLNRPKADKGDRVIVKFELPLSMAQSDRIKALARAKAVPLKTVLLAAHVKVMSVMGGINDVMTYTVGNGRPENRDAHAVVGLFVNSLAFRQKLPGGTWSDLIHDALRTELQVLAHRRFPMAELKRQHGSEPLAETLFFFNHYHVTDVLSQWGNFSLDGLKVYAESTFPYCVNAYIEPFTGKLRVRVEYDRLQYSAQTMDLLNHCFVSVLDAMSTDPSGRYDDDDFLAPDVRERVRALSTGQALDATTDGSVLDAFARHVAARPEHAAVVCGQTSLSYAELDAASRRVAAALARRGIGPGDIVAIAMERGAEAVVGMLGVMTAGASYVPLDLATPVERTRHVLGYTRASLLLTRARDRDALDGLSDAALTIEQALGEAEDGFRQPPARGLAYVIYTSGTTGQPKGVMIDHASLLASTRARFSSYGFSPASFLLLSSHAFDSSVAGVYWTLCGGGTLVLPSSAQLDVTELPALIARHWVTELLCIPSFYAVLLDELEGRVSGGGLRSAIVAGEACPRDIRERHDAVLPGTMLFNEYGPTEATVWATVQRCDDLELDPASRGAVLPIGSAVPGAAAWVMDANMNLVPFGVSGELYLGGDGVGIGYLDNPQLTASRFVPDPMGSDPGARLYRTGDIVRMDADGRIEFLGRRDRMVKIQGFRVELLEVEQMLDKHPAVQRSLVHAVQAHGQSTQLVAYVVPEPTEVFDSADLQAFVRRYLPKYMVPSQVISLATLPMRRDGGIDMAALPVPAATEETVAPPTTPTEAALVGIWSEVLGRDKVGIHADFHALGGESLGALRIVSRIGKAFDVRVPVGRLLTDFPSVAALGTYVDELRAEKDASPRVEGQEVP
ncbi:non-ribosomal peptide synthetase [Xanthomonas citri]|uniref:non-ribosomal peptide synthetase n=1 Tax=Xanthomonas citri TaxID=346 RepID=UPI0002D79D11|nr:non-ribosomal peptide synthetase [Xanthomonas citri]